MRFQALPDEEGMKVAKKRAEKSFQDILGWKENIGLFAITPPTSFMRTCDTLARIDLNCGGKLEFIPFFLFFSLLDQKHKQTLTFNGGVTLGNFDGKILVASVTSIYRLKPVSVQIQIEVCTKVLSSMYFVLYSISLILWAALQKLYPNWLHILWL